MMFDAVVIGTGVVGAAVARVLSRYAASVAVLEKAGDVCMGASKANSGIVHAGYDAEPGSLKARFNVAGARMYPELAKELGVPFDAPGALIIGFTEEDKETLKQLYLQGKENGVTGLALIEGEEALRLEPNLNPDVRYALHVLTSGLVSPYEMAYALIDHAAVNGVQLHLENKVLSIAEIPGGFEIKTDKQILTCRAVVNCAGAGAAALHRMLVDDDVQVTPRKGEYYLMDRQKELPFKRTIFQCPTKMGKGVLISPTVHGNILLGPNALDIGDAEDTATTAESLKEVLEKSRLTWPQVNTRTNITTFAGVRAHEKKGDFIVGQTKEGLFEALGVESPGLTAAPAIAEELGAQVAQYLKADKKADYLPPIKRRKPFNEMTDQERQAAYLENPLYGAVVCRCECVTEAEIVDAIHRPAGAKNLDAVKRRTRAGMGRCQGGFCSPRVVEILAREMNVPVVEVTKRGGDSQLFTGILGGGDE